MIVLLGPGKLLSLLQMDVLLQLVVYPIDAKRSIEQGPSIPLLHSSVWKVYKLCNSRSTTMEGNSCLFFVVPKNNIQQAIKRPHPKLESRSGDMEPYPIAGLQ